MVRFCPGIMSFGLPKLAAVALLTRLLSPGQLHKIFLWCLVIVCLFSILGCVFVLFSRCTPQPTRCGTSTSRPTPVFPSGSWFITPSMLGVSAIIHAGCDYSKGQTNPQPQRWVMFSALTDIAVYPAIVLFKLQMQWKKELELSAALGVASMYEVIFSVVLPSESESSILTIHLVPPWSPSTRPLAFPASLAMTSATIPLTSLSGPREPSSSS